MGIDDNTIVNSIVDKKGRCGLVSHPCFDGIVVHSGLYGGFTHILSRTEAMGGCKVSKGSG